MNCIELKPKLGFVFKFFIITSKMMMLVKKLRGEV